MEMQEMEIRKNSGSGTKMTRMAGRNPEGLVIMPSGGA